MFVFKTTTFVKSGYGKTLGIKSFLTVDEFISFVLLFVLAFGGVFEMPIIMAGLTSLGVMPIYLKKVNFQ